MSELAQFEEEDARAVFRWNTEEERDEPKEHVSGSRTLLFLKRKPTRAEAPPRWVSANEWGEMMFSVAWIEHGDVFAFLRLEDAVAKDGLAKAGACLPAARPVSENEREEGEAPAGVDYWIRLLSDELDRALADRSRLRAASVLVAAQRFLRSHGRWPETAAEACGGKDPTEGLPLTVSRRGDGSFAITLAARVGRRGQEVTPALPPSR